MFAVGRGMQRNRLVQPAWLLFSMMIASGLAVAGCAATPDESDPDADDEELWDEGPPGGDDVGETTSGVGAAPKFQLPFPCGQVWSGQRWIGASGERCGSFGDGGCVLADRDHGEWPVLEIRLLRGPSDRPLCVVRAVCADDNASGVDHR